MGDIYPNVCTMNWQSNFPLINRRPHLERAGGGADALFNYGSIRLLSIQLLWSWSSALWMLRVFNNGQVCT